MTFTSAFPEILQTAFSLYFGQETRYKSLSEIPLDGKALSDLTGQNLTRDEHIILLLALMPHLNPQALDLFFVRNANLDRPYTEFGGWQGISHTGFLPTGETAAFLLTIGNPDNRLQIMQLFSRTHWFYRRNILRLKGQGKDEPFLSGKLCLSEEFLAKVLENGTSGTGYGAETPCKRITTPSDWEDLVVPAEVLEELENVSGWLRHDEEIRSRWNLEKYIRPGYRCLFYGLPGTGKTFAAALLGKRSGLEVYRIGLSVLTSGETGETIKNLAEIFDLARQRDWILLFDGAERLCGEDHENSLLDNRRINEEILTCLLGCTEDFPGLVIMAASLQDDPDQRFLRYFHSALHFPMPDRNARIKLWRQMIPGEWLYENKEALIQTAAEAELPPGSMVNVIRQCAVRLLTSHQNRLTAEILNAALAKEKAKY
ncbi:ATP-binding protein [Chryseobacterium hagamense]|uniref:AAA+ ATPase domain-containing protein n=1 Tax=Chryseobacterium hagamense TaxID=395935 RepID=A0A511YJH6_9FLAO|nr:ATP-binding protein [Chryseobacterium hagamense]GEN75324.1 hypothetical protein CHA01nite_10640 [Chryseobacterium hagamense]